jgi:hypothetical protein
VGVGAWLLVRFAVVFVGLEVGAAVLLHVTESVWVALVLYPLVYLLAFLLLAMMVPGMEEPKGWGVLAIIVVPVAALAVMHLTYSGLDQRTLHARGRVERARVTDVYWVDQGADAPTHVAELADPSGRPLPGIVSGDGLKVGQITTVTVDPRGKIPVLLGISSTGTGKFRAAGITAGVEILVLAIAAYRGAVDRPATERADRPKRTRKPKDLPA